VNKLAEIIKKMVGIKDQYLYIILWIVVAIPLIHPLGLGISVGSLERKAYDTIQATPDGSYVVMMESFDTFTIDSEGPTRVLIEHLFRKNMKILFVPHSPPSISNVLTVLAQAPSAKNKVYGVDYIMLQVLVDDEVNIARWAANIPGTSPVDGLYGKPVTDYPIMAGVNSVDDLALGVAKQAEGQAYIRQVAGAYGLPTVMVHGTDYLSKHSSLVQAGIIQGAVDGITAYAAYEKLLNIPGPASAQMDSMSLAVVMAVILLIIGNLNMLLQRGKQQVSGGT